MFLKYFWFEYIVSLEYDGSQVYTTGNGNGNHKKTFLVWYHKV